MPTKYRHPDTKTQEMVDDLDRRLAVLESLILTPGRILHFADHNPEATGIIIFDPALPEQLAETRSRVPEGWVLCEGRRNPLPIDQYPRLYETVGGYRYPSETFKPEGTFFTPDFHYVRSLFNNFADRANTHMMIKT